MTKFRSGLNLLDHNTLSTVSKVRTVLLSYLSLAVASYNQQGNELRPSTLSISHGSLHNFVRDQVILSLSKGTRNQPQPATPLQGELLLRTQCHTYPWTQPTQYSLHRHHLVYL